jgi:hypothetical protein
VWLAVELLYDRGISCKPRNVLVGELRSDETKGIHSLRLMKLSHMNGKDIEPLAVLWKPEIVRVGNSIMRLRGLEARGNGKDRQWFAQVWHCEVLTHSQAANYGKPRMVTGTLPPFKATI